MFWSIAYVSFVVLAHIVMFMELKYWKAPLWYNCVVVLFGIFSYLVLAPVMLHSIGMPYWACLGVPSLVLFAAVTFESPAGRFLYFFKMRRNNTAYYNDLDGYIPPRNNDSKINDSKI